MRQDPSKARQHADIAAPDEGTTLIEVLIVMAILALVAAVALPSVRAPDRAHSLRSIAADIAGRLRAARATALWENREVAFALTLRRAPIPSKGRVRRSRCRPR
jgi:type II secretion system protein H